MNRLVCLAILLLGCAHRRARAPVPSSAEARVFYYHDNEGLQVVTTGVHVTKPLPHGDSLSLSYVLDHVDIPAADAVSRASAKVGDGLGIRKDRNEINVGYSLDLSRPRAAMQLGANARVSLEPDYRSFSGELRYSAELNRNNTLVSAALGYGHDTITPKSFHPDDAGRWPASHDRVTFALSLRQLLSTRMDLSAGAGLGHQEGALSSPYRRALVLEGAGVFAKPHEEAERHPGERTRVTAFAALGAYLGRGAALHVRLGGYADTWGVLALTPEVAAVFQLHPRVLLTLGYRYYVQSSADFYAVKYRTFEAIRSGDRRLGALDEHLPGIELRWTLVRSLEAIVAYQLSLMRYWALSATVTAQLPSVGFSFVY